MRVESILKRLGLLECRHTMIGGTARKGISGGEKKRVSIGYELITDPTLLLCDEPTSGLDSSTSLKICKMLKKEAVENNLTIICTIHSPSSEIFNSFDRLLLLHEGHQIYQGDIHEKIQEYLFKSMGVMMAKFVNPADFLVKMGQAPHKISKDLTLQQLVSTYREVIEPEIDQGIGMRNSRYTEFITNFKDFSESKNFFV